MTGRTHLVVGLTAGLLVAHWAGVQGIGLMWCVVSGGVGGLLPDIDHPRSIISGYVPGSGVLRLAISHRGPTHTFLALLVTCFAAAIGTGITQSVMPMTPRIAYEFTLGAVAIASGYALHLICDMATPAGIPLLLPVSRRAWRIAPRAMLWASAWLLESIATVGALVLTGAILIGVV